MHYLGIVTPPHVQIRLSLNKRSNFLHTTCESTCDTLPSSAANQGDNTVLVVQGGTATPATIKQLFPPDRVFKINIYLYICQVNWMQTLHWTFVHLHFSAVCDLKMHLLLAVDVIATVSRFCIITQEWWFRMHIIHIKILSISVIYSVCFPSVLSFLSVTAQKHSRQTSYIILQKDVICWSMGPLRWVVSKRKAPGLSLSR